MNTGYYLGDTIWFKAYVVFAEQLIDWAYNGGTIMIYNSKIAKTVFILVMCSMAF